MRKIITLASLGLSCQTAHQLTRYTEENPTRARFAKSPFDWLICAPENAADWLAQGLCEFNATDLISHRGRAYWPQFSFWFWHGFITIQGADRTLDIIGNAKKELSKLAYQRESFSRLDPDNTVFCISNTQNNLETEVFEESESSHYHFSRKSIDYLQSSLDSFFQVPVQLKVITRPNRASANLIEQDNVFLLPVDENDWKGNRRTWDTVLDQLIDQHKTH